MSLAEKLHPLPVLSVVAEVAFEQKEGFLTGAHKVQCSHPLKRIFEYILLWVVSLELKAVKSM